MNKTVSHRGKQASSNSRNPDRLSRTDWIVAARDALIQGGVHAIKVDLIANQLKITRGSFYWHFRDRAELLSAVLELWESQNTKPFEDIAQRADQSAAEKFVLMAKLWLEETSFDWAFDSAMRDWARSSRSVAEKISAIDQLRMTLFEEVFKEMGYAAREAKIRARITYYHQVGYYALEIKESKKDRREMFPTYLSILVGDAHLKGMKL